MRRNVERGPRLGRNAGPGPNTWRSTAGRAGGAGRAGIGGLAGLVSLAIVLAACGGPARPASKANGTSGLGGKVAASHGNYVVKGPHGNTDFNFNSSTLPKGFPSGIPLPSGSTIIGYVASGQAGLPGWQITLGAPGPASTAASAYEAKLSGDGFTSVGAYQTQVAYGVQATKGRWKVVASVTPSTTGASGLGLPSKDVAVVLMVSGTSATAPPGS